MFHRCFQMFTDVLGFSLFVPYMLSRCSQVVLMGHMGLVGLLGLLGLLGLVGLVVYGNPKVYGDTSIFDGLVHIIIASSPI